MSSALAEGESVTDGVPAGEPKGERRNRNHGQPSLVGENARVTEDHEIHGDVNLLSSRPA